MAPPPSDRSLILHLPASASPDAPEPKVRIRSPLAGCGKSRDFEKNDHEMGSMLDYGHIRSMGYGCAPVGEWQRNDDNRLFPWPASRLRKKSVGGASSPIRRLLPLRNPLI